MRNIRFLSQVVEQTHFSLLRDSKDYLTAKEEFPLALPLEIPDSVNVTVFAITIILGKEIQLFSSPKSQFLPLSIKGGMTL